MASQNKIGVIITADDRTRAAFESAKKNLSGINTAAASATKALASIGVGLSVAGITAFVKGSIDAADNMRDMAIATGTSVQSLAKYELAAKQSGTSVDALAAGMGKLSVFMAQNADEARQLGITAQDPAEAFAQLAGALERAVSPADRNAIAMKVLGKSYAELMPLMAQGEASLRAQTSASAGYAKNMADLADKADEFNDGLEKLKQNTSNVGISLANTFLPALNAIAAGFDNASRSRISFMQGASLGVNIWNNTGKQLKDVRDEIKSLESQQATAESLGFGRYKALDARIAAAKELKKQLEEVQRAEALALLDNVQKKGSQPPAFTTGIKFEDFDKKTKNTTKAKKTELDVIDPFYEQRKAAMRDAVAAQNAEFDRLYEDQRAKIDADEEYAASLGRIRDEMIGIIDPIEKYRDELDKIDKLVEAGLFTPEQAAAARLYWQEQIDSAAGFNDAVKTKSSEIDIFLQNAAKSMQDSLADFLFDPFADGLDGMVSGFAKTVQRMAADALAAQIMKNVFDLKSGGGIGGGAGGFISSITSFFGFADGGIMSSNGPLALKAYASGGVANSPQLALFGEGAMNEAFVPLPDGRSIPVKMQGNNAPAPAQNIRIVNAYDNAHINDYLGSTSGEKVILNAIRRNAGAVRGMMS